MLLLKCRDRDKRVQLSAYELLASMDSAELHRSMNLSQWRDVLDAGLGVWQAAQQTEGKHLSSDNCTTHIVSYPTDGLSRTQCFTARECPEGD